MTERKPRTPRTPSVTTDLAAGTAAEHLVCAELLLLGYRAFLTDQTCSYDIAVDLDHRLVRIQVKATRELKATPQRKAHVPAYLWHVRRVGRSGTKRYEDNAYDLLALVALDIRRIAFLPPEMKLQCIHILPPGGRGRGKRFEDFPFAAAASRLSELHEAERAARLAVIEERRADSGPLFAEHRSVRVIAPADLHDGPPSRDDLDALRHMLGLPDEWQRPEPPFRNHYATTPGDAQMETLRAMGLVDCAGSRPAIFGDLAFYRATDAGRAVALASVRRLRLTKGQRVYRAWLNLDSSLSFGEFLKSDDYAPSRRSA